jgi:hypothetical protein
VGKSIDEAQKAFKWIKVLCMTIAVIETLDFTLSKIQKLYNIRE